MGRFSDRIKQQEQVTITPTGITEGVTTEVQPQFVSPGVSPVQQIGAVSAVSPPMGRFSQRALQKQPEPELGFWEGIKESVTGTRRTTPEIERLPEVTDPGALKFPKFKQNIKAAAGMLLASDVEDQKNILEPMGVKFREDSKGNVIGQYEGKEFVLNKPGFSFIDAQQSVADIAAFLPAAKLASFGTNLATRIGLGAVGAGATEYALGEAREAIGAEEQPISEAGEAAAIEAGAEAAIPAIARVGGPIGRVAAKGLSATKIGEPLARGIERARSKAVEKMGKIVDEEAFKTLKRSQKIEKEVPLGILGPQASEVPSDLVALRVLHEQPATSREMATIDKMQDKAGKREFYKFLAKVAKSDAFEKGAADFKKAAESSVERMKKERRDATEGLYQQIFEAPTDVNVSRAISKIDEKLDITPPGPLKSNLEKARKTLSQERATGILDETGEPIKTATGTMPIEVAHRARMQLRDMIERKGDKALDPTAKRDLVEVQELLTDSMSNPDFGGVPEYGEVTEIYKKMSEPINELQESIVGKGIKLKDADLNKMSETIFDSKKVSPNQIRALKKVVDRADPEAFDRLLRAKILRSLKSIPDTLAKPKGKDKYSVSDFRSALGKTPADQDLIKASLSPEQKKNFVYLREQLRKASLGRAGGSDTASKSTLIEKMRGTVAGTLIAVGAPLYAFGSVGAGLSGARLLSSKVKDKTLDKRLGYLYEAILDPKWDKDMARIRRMDPKTPSAGRAMAQLINNIESQDKEE
jgi:hypothetical protein